MNAGHDRATSLGGRIVQAVRAYLALRVAPLLVGGMACTLIGLLVLGGAHAAHARGVAAAGAGLVVGVMIAAALLPLAAEIPPFARLVAVVEAVALLAVVGGFVTYFHLDWWVYAFTAIFVAPLCVVIAANALLGIARIAGRRRRWAPAPLLGWPGADDDRPERRDDLLGAVEVVLEATEQLRAARDETTAQRPSPGQVTRRPSDGA